jgi:type II secretory pathway component GspD/PulD (secretin)
MGVSANALMSGVRSLKTSIETNRVCIGVVASYGFLRRILAAAMVVVLSAVWPVIAFSADDFVGVLSLAVQDDVAAKLQLSAEQKTKLHSVIEDCENKAVDLVMQWNDLPAADREQKLAAFRRESEAKGLALLNAEQQKRLEQMRLGKLGLASLTEPGVAERIALSEEQKKQIADLLEKRKQDLAKANDKTASVIQAESERKLAAVLTEKQKADWDSLTLVQSLPEAAASTTAETKPSPSGQSKPQETAADKPAPATAQATSATATHVEPPKHPDKIRFKFSFASWNVVLKWFAEQADLSLVMDTPPPGTFNYTDDKEFKPEEAIDLLNRVLLTKGYYLLRRDRMLMLVNLEDGIPPNLVPNVPLNSLDKRSESEIVSVIFDLAKLSPDEAAAEIEKLRGPQTGVVTLPKSRILVVTDTVARLKIISGVIQRVEDPEGINSGQLRTFTLRFVTPEEILPNLRQLLDIQSDQFKTSDGSLLLTVDTNGKRLIATGRPEKLARLESILKVIDAPRGGGDAGVLEGSPQVEVYSINTADPQSTLKVMQTLLAGLPDVRMDIDPKTNNLVVLARPAQHATIRATLDQMQHDARQVAVIRLRMVDPQMAVLSINKLFGGGDASKSGAGPQVDADPSTRQLMIRGTASQIEQISSMLKKMGETETNPMVTAGAGKMRMLPLSQRSLGPALERLQEIWPSMRQNKIRVVAPSNAIPTFRPSESEEQEPQQDLLDRSRRAPSGSDQEGKRPASLSPREKGSLPPEPPSDAKPLKRPTALDDRTTDNPQPARFRLVADEIQTDTQTPDKIAFPITTVPQPQASTPAASSDKKEPAAIIVAPGPGGVMIASEDEEALNEFEKLLTSLAGGSSGSRPQLNMFFLKHAKAATVGATIDQVLGGGTLSTGSSTNSGDGGSLLGNLAGAALGDSGGGILGSLLSGGGTGRIQPSGTIKITPDSRLNALIVQANDTDLDTIEQLLKILDQKESPEEIQVSPRAKMIQLYNTDATAVAEIVQQVYRDRMVLSSSQTQGAQGMGGPQAFLQQMMGGGRGGRGGGRGGSQQADETPKMSIGVDVRTNSLIVAASESLFEEVKQLVETLDTTTPDVNDTVQVVTLHKSSTQSVEQALSALGGENIQVTRTAGSAGNMPMGQYGQGRGGMPGQNYQRSNRGSGQQGRTNQQSGQRGGGGGNFSGGGGNFGGGGVQRGGGSGNFGGGGGNFGGGGGNFGGGGGNFGGGGGGQRGGGGGGGGQRGGGGGGGGQRGGGGGLYSP